MPVDDAPVRFLLVLLHREIRRREHHAAAVQDATSHNSTTRHHQTNGSSRHHTPQLTTKQFNARIQEITRACAHIASTQKHNQLTPQTHTTNTHAVSVHLVKTAESNLVRVRVGGDARKHTCNCMYSLNLQMVQPTVMASASACVLEPRITINRAIPIGPEPLPVSTHMRPDTHC